MTRRLMDKVEDRRRYHKDVDLALLRKLCGYIVAFNEEGPAVIPVTFMMPNNVTRKFQFELKVKEPVTLKGDVVFVGGQKSYGYNLGDQVYNLTKPGRIWAQAGNVSDELIWQAEVLVTAQYRKDTRLEGDSSFEGA